MLSSRENDSLLNVAIETVKAYGSPTASEYASRIAFLEPGCCTTPETERATETLSEKVEGARSTLRSGADGATCMRVLGGLPDCAEKHYLMAIALMREAGTHSVNDDIRREIERALAQDPKNAVYEELGRLIHEETLADENRLRNRQSKQRRIVDRLARRIGI